MKNPILDEIRHTRESLLSEAGGTLDGLVDRLQAEERGSDHPTWKPAEGEGRPASPPSPPRAGDAGAKQAAG
jgi:hypothetical protein